MPYGICMIFAAVMLQTKHVKPEMRARSAKWKERILLQMPGDMSDRLLRHTLDEFASMLCEDGPVLLEGGGVELVVHHLPADPPLLTIAHVPEIPVETRPASKHSE